MQFQETVVFQAQDLVEYIKAESETPEGVWGTNIFGKSVEELVLDGMRNKDILPNTHMSRDNFNLRVNTSAGPVDFDFRVLRRRF